MRMTNREKFREVYGFDTDCGKCNPYPCKEDDCEWWEQCKDHPGCPCENWWDLEYKAPAAKNDIPYCQCTDAEIAKSFIEDVEADKDQLPTTKNDLGVDCISRQAVLDWIADYDLNMGQVVRGIHDLPSVTPQEPRWIPMIRREPTDEEKAEYLAQNGEELGYMLENEMPLNGQEVLVSIGKYVSEDVFDEDFYNFENNDIENVDAWMPKPKPYEPQESEDKE